MLPQVQQPCRPDGALKMVRFSLAIALKELNLNNHGHCP